MLANILTLSRLGLMALAVVFLHTEEATLSLTAFVLIVITLLVDAVDGTVARRRGSASALGAILDIAIDRVVENVFWITFVSLELVDLWVALVVVTRGTLTDAVRGYALGEGLTPFEMMKTSWGRWLVSHRFLRAVYGTAKTVTFPALALLQTARLVTVDSATLASFTWLVRGLVLFTVSLTLLRGIPVLIEARRFFVHQPNEKEL